MADFFSRSSTVTSAGRSDSVFLVQLMGVSERASITGAKLGCADPQDDMFLETAMVGEADHLITGDRHLLEMTPFREYFDPDPAGFPERLRARPIVHTDRSIALTPAYTDERDSGLDVMGSRGGLT